MNKETIEKIIKDSIHLFGQDNVVEYGVDEMRKILEKHLLKE